MTCRRRCGCGTLSWRAVPAAANWRTRVTATSSGAGCWRGWAGRWTMYWPRDGPRRRGCATPRRSWTSWNARPAATRRGRDEESGRMNRWEWVYDFRKRAEETRCLSFASAGLHTRRSIPPLPAGATGPNLAQGLPHRGALRLGRHAEEDAVVLVLLGRPGVDLQARWWQGDGLLAPSQEFRYLVGRFLLG